MTTTRGPLALIPLIAGIALLLPACGGGGGGGDDTNPDQRSFTLRIENLSIPYSPVGVFDTPDGSAAAGPATPGNSFSFQFFAEPGERLSFATMYGQSNDLFFAPAPAGIELWNGGNPVTGDVSAQVDLWDAGTEVNEPPGSGPTQAPRQAGPNTGPDEGGLVRSIDDVNDGFSYFRDVTVTLSVADGMFTATIENPANSTTPLSPGVFVVHSTAGPIFQTDEKDRGEGLEAQAEDGNAAGLAGSLALRAGLVSSQVFDSPVTAGGTGPATPGDAFEMQFAASPGDRVSFATMYGQSNDLFFAPSDQGIELFDGNGDPVTGDVSAQIDLWDAGTEVNEMPGAGPNQAPRQPAPDSGALENEPVRPVSEAGDGFTWFADIEASLAFADGMFTLTITNPPASPTPLSPGVLVVHRDRGPLFVNGIEDRGLGLERIAEEGSPLALATRIQNLRGHAQSGVFNTPDGAGSPGPALPGQSFSFTFDASPGYRLSFATMYGQSNDLFFAPDPEGISLFDGAGDPVTGDVSSMVGLWDAGSEVNEMPGAGPNQAPRQPSFDAGNVEREPVRSIDMVGDGFTWFTDVGASLTWADGSFTLTIMNPANSPTPLSPGVFVVHREPGPIFMDGERDRGEGLEAIAERGSPGGLAAVIARDLSLAARLAAHGTPISPGAWAVHMLDRPIFDEGVPDRGLGLEGQAEDGSTASLAASLMGRSSVSSSGSFSTPVGSASTGPAGPGHAFEVTFTAEPGDRLSFASMFGQSNDWFFSPDQDGLPLFDGSGDPIRGDITDQIGIRDAGTERNERPGAGAWQAPRQPAPDTGPEDAAPVERIRDLPGDFVRPRVGRLIRVTLGS